MYRRLWIKIVFAAASGLCTAEVLDGADIGLPVFALAGLLFAVGVFLPHLRRDRFVVYRGMGLLLVSVISFVCAFDTAALLAGSTPGVPWLMYVAASLVGAAVVLFGAHLLIPLKHSDTLAVTGCASAIAGGFGFEMLGAHSFALPFILWHVLMALAIHTAEARNSLSYRAG